MCTSIGTKTVTGSVICLALCFRWVMVWNGDSQKRENVRWRCPFECLLSSNGQPSCSGGNRIDLSLMKQLFAPFAAAPWQNAALLNTTVPFLSTQKPHLNLMCSSSMIYDLSIASLNRPHAVKETKMVLSVLPIMYGYSRCLSYCGE